MAMLVGSRHVRWLVVAFFLALTIFYLSHSRPVSQEAAPAALLPGLDSTDQPAHDEAPPDRPSIPPPHHAEPSTHEAGQEVRPSPKLGSVHTTPEGAEAADKCIGFEAWQKRKPEPMSEGKRQFPYVRPPPECRTFPLPSLEALISRMKGVIADPDLFRLFENSYPNTLDTMVKWHGFAKETDAETGEDRETDEELSYLITGDIDAAWIRDSSSQLGSYLSLLEPSEDPSSLASLWRGLINAHARSILISPYCHAFQPPPESGIPPTTNGAYAQNHPNPRYDPNKVFDCKWELDSLAYFLQLSVSYYAKTGDLAFFQKYRWVPAVEAAVKAAGAMRTGTYDPDGKVLRSAWTFTGWTDRGTETLTNNGLGNPVRENGMVRSAFRPSDDACIFQLFTPANMMWAKYLEEASLIMERLEGEKAQNLTAEMRDFAGGVRRGIDRDAIVSHRDFGRIFAYEVDGFGSANLMDDANIPSLLAMPLFNYQQSSLALNGGSPGKGSAGEANDYGAIYRNTRRFVLSDANPYFAKGPVLSAVGGPHLGPGKGWPMAAIVAAMTAYDPITGSEDAEAEAEKQLRMVLDSTDSKGVIHESVSAWRQQTWTRAWFGWANGLFGELILKIEENDRKSSRGRLLSKSFQ